MDGVFFIDKAQGISSFGVLRKMRRHLAELSDTKIKNIKIGHAGTLDPAATGLLIVCVGQATKISSYLMRDEKQYSLDIVLGQQTDTDDNEGQVIHSSDEEVDLQNIEQVCQQFVGSFEQLPPNFSAIKHKGKKLYEYAREGQTVERKLRPVEIFSLDRIEYNYPILKIKVHCSKGTYMRALARDIGERLGVGAHAQNIHRLQSGEFDLTQAISLEHFLGLSYDELNQCKQSLEKVLQSMPSLPPFDENSKKSLLHGQFLECAADPGEYVLFDSANKVFALGTVEQAKLKLKRALSKAL